MEFCKKVDEKLRENGWEVELDISDSSLNKKVRNA
jgi:threonyl-tRNA synthetase